MNRLFIFWPIGLIIACLCAGILGTFGHGHSERIKSREVKDYVDIGSRLELMVDGFIVAEYHGGARLQMHNPQPQNVVIIHDKPWEGKCNYYTIFKDSNIYRMYYSASNGKATCYAESSNGINFTKPELGIIEFDSSKANNIIWNGDPISHNFTPFKDTNPSCPPEQLYKALGGIDGSGLLPLVSADGIHWSKMDNKPVLTDGWFDSQNVAFWDNQCGHYRVYYRDWHRESPLRRLRGIMTDRVHRGIKTATSDDFIHWTTGQWLEFSEAHNDDVLLTKVDLYTNSIKPYYRAPHIYIGFPVRYVERAFGESSRQLPDAEEHEQLMRHEERDFAITEGLLMTSRDGETFRLWDEAFIRPGFRLNNWLYGNNYIAWHVVETISEALGNPPELSLYATIKDKGIEKHDKLLRYTMRLDGFVSLNSPLTGGELITKPIRFEGDRLVVNYSTSAAGVLRIEIQDASSKPIPGFTLSECDEIYGDQLARTVTWLGKHDVAAIQGKTVRLRFALKDADLYSFAFSK